MSKILPLPCPFCGAQPKFGRLTDKEVKPELPRGFWSLGCPGRPIECTGHPMSFGDTKAEAINEWNTRSETRALEIVRLAREFLTAVRIARKECEEEGEAVADLTMKAAIAQTTLYAALHAFDGKGAGQ